MDYNLDIKLMIKNKEHFNKWVYIHFIQISKEKE